MQVWVVGQRLAPGMQNRREADLGTEMLAIAGNGFERLGRRLKQKAVDNLLVLVPDGGNLLPQREDDVEILNRQQIGLARFQPRPSGRALARRTMSVSAAAVGDLSKPALLAAPNVASQRRRAAGLDRPHHATLATIEVAGIGLAIGFTVAAEDIRHLEVGTSHARGLSPTARIPPEAASPAPRASNARAGSVSPRWCWSKH
jgi:hypothetical protein